MQSFNCDDISRTQAGAYCVVDCDHLRGVGSVKFALGSFAPNLKIWRNCPNTSCEHLSGNCHRHRCGSLRLWLLGARAASDSKCALRPLWSMARLLLEARAPHPRPRGEVDD